MDATQYAESDYITAKIVQDSKSKQLVITSDAKAEETEYGQRLTMHVEIDGKKKTYRPNKDTIKNLISVHGADTKSWLGKVLKLNVISVMGKDSVIGTPTK